MSQNPSNKNLEDKLDRMSEDLTDIKVTLGKHSVYHEANTESLIEHMARTKINEERLEMLKTEVNALEKHKERVMGIVKGITLVFVVAAGLIAALKQLGLI